MRKRACGTPEDSKKPTKEQIKNAKVTHLLALILGHNELAKQAVSLGEKMYHRLACEQYAEAVRELDHKFVISESEPKLVTLGTERASVNLYPRDIELMRKAIAEYDAKEKT
jgi:hypothetical protein